MEGEAFYGDSLKQTIISNLILPEKKKCDIPFLKWREYRFQENSSINLFVYYIFSLHFIAVVLLNNRLAYLLFLEKVCSRLKRKFRLDPFYHGISHPFNL